MRTVVAIFLLCVGCDQGSRTTKRVLAAPVEVVLERSAGLPLFDIQATFGADVDPGPHIQPVTAALAEARAICSRDGRTALAAVMSVEVRGKRLHAEARNPTAACLARAIDGKRVDDPIDYVVELLVSAG